MDLDVDRELSERVEYLQRRVDELERTEDRHRRSEELLAVLASFPRQNPNPVIETDFQGKVRYLNPAARECFPELQTRGFDHPLLMGLAAIIRSFEERVEGPG